MIPVKLTAELVEAFAGTFLSPHYDEPRPTPDFHREVWDLWCSDRPQCAAAAPRNHAKSTALTHDFGLAAALFRAEDYIIILGSSEEMAIEHLNDISMELHENDDLVREFGVKQFLVDQKTDIVVECKDSHQFRFVARGTEQKIRGRKWRGKRPGLILGDDIEDDEQVESKERRQKVSRWFFRAAKQALRDGGKIRVAGTVLGYDSLLSNLLHDKEGRPIPGTLCYRAHRSFDDFSDILWPEKFPEERLRLIRQEFIDAGDASGYSAEYLNDPLDSSDAYLRREDFIPMDEEDHIRPKRICAAADFAISKADKANRTSFTIGGKCTMNRIHFLDQRTDRWNSLQIIEEMFSVQERWSPEIFWVEDGQIWKAISPMLYQEMERRDVTINVEPRVSIKDKSVRGRSLQRNTRAGLTRWDKSASWYPGMEAELLRFTPNSQSLDDQFDSAAQLSAGFDSMSTVNNEDFETQPEGDEQGFWNRHRQRDLGIPRPGRGGY